MKIRPDVRGRYQSEYGVQLYKLFGGLWNNLFGFGYDQRLV
jgi:hypothetical protein